jgi:hypothetical protein
MNISRMGGKHAAFEERNRQDARARRERDEASAKQSGRGEGQASLANIVAIAGVDMAAARPLRSTLGGASQATSGGDDARDE